MAPGEGLSDDSFRHAVADELRAFVDQVVSLAGAEADASQKEVRTELEQARRIIKELMETISALELERDKAARARMLAEQAWEHVEAEAHRTRIAFERRIRELEAEIDAMGQPKPPSPPANPAPPDPQPPSPRVLTFGDNRSEPDSVATIAPPPAGRPEIETYVGQLLDHLQATYRADAVAEMPVDTRVDRLRANLVFAKEAYGRRVLALKVPDDRLLDRRLAELIDAESATSFGRDLAAALLAVSAEERAARATAS
jgi:hypothetical protein